MVGSRVAQQVNKVWPSDPEGDPPLDVLKIDLGAWQAGLLTESQVGGLSATPGQPPWPMRPSGFQQPDVLENVCKCMYRPLSGGVYPLKNYVG